MTTDTSLEEPASLASQKLRPAKLILKKIKNDPTYEVEDFVVGYIDRVAGIIEKPVTDWEEKFEPEYLIAYFRRISDDVVVWDKLKKTDLLLGSS